MISNRSTYFSLMQLCDIRIGRTPSRAREEYWGEGYPWLSIADMQQGKNLAKTKETITQKAVDECHCYQVQPGTLLMSFKLSIGKLGFARIPMYTNEAIAALVIRNKKQITSDYLYYALQVIDLAGNTDRAVKGKTLDTEKVGLLRIPLLPLHEQKRIAAILAKADRVRRLRRYALELSGSYLQAVFLEMFGDPVTNPKEWPVTFMGDLLAIPPHLGTITPAKESGKQLCVRVGEVGDWQVNLNQCKYVSLEGNELQRFSLHTDDIVLARAIGSEAHLGKLSIMAKSPIPVVFDSHLMRIRTDPSRLLTLFLACWLKTDGGRARFMQQARQTSVQFNINAEQLVSIEIPLPPIPLQQKFAKIIERYLRLQAQQQEALRQAEHLFQTLLHKAFQGELTSDDENRVEEPIAVASQKIVGSPEPIDVRVRQLALPLE